MVGVRATPIPLLLVETAPALEPGGLIEPLLLVVAALAIEAPPLGLLLLGGVPWSAVDFILRLLGKPVLCSQLLRFVCLNLGSE